MGLPSRASAAPIAAKMVIKVALNTESPILESGPIRAAFAEEIASAEMGLPDARCSSSASVTPRTAFPV